MATQANTFREFVANISPGSWKLEWGQKLLQGTIGLLFDMLSSGAEMAVRSSKLGSSNCPVDAVDLIGQERNFARFSSETDDGYAARVADAWTLWQQAGTDGGIIAMFARAGFTATIIHNRDWAWTWGGGVWGDGGIWGGGDGEPENWSRFWVVISDHTWVSEGTWGTAGDWGDNGTWGTGATPDDVRAARQIVNTFKPANAVCVAICIVLDEPTWTSEQTDWYDYDARSEAARYW